MDELLEALEGRMTQRLDEQQQRIEQQQQAIESLQQQLEELRGAHPPLPPPANDESEPTKAKKKAKPAKAEEPAEEEEGEQQVAASSSSKKRKRGGAEGGVLSLFIDSQGRKQIQLYNEKKRNAGEFVASWLERFSPDAVDTNKRSALYIASYQGKISLVTEFLKEGADANYAEPKVMYTPLLGIAYSQEKMTMEVREQIARALLGAGADIQCVETEFNFGVLHLSACNNHAGLLRLFLRVRNVQFSHVDKEERTALHVAVEFGRLDAASILLADSRCTNAYLRLQNSSGHTALICAREEAKTSQVGKAILALVRDKLDGGVLSGCSPSSTMSPKQSSPPAGGSKSKSKSKSKKSPSKKSPSKKKARKEEVVEDSEEGDDDDDEEEDDAVPVCGWCERNDVDVSSTNMMPPGRKSQRAVYICDDCQAHIQRSDSTTGEEVLCCGTVIAQNIERPCPDGERGFFTTSPKSKNGKSSSASAWRCETCTKKQEEIDGDLLSNKLHIVVDNDSRIQQEVYPLLEMKVNGRVTYQQLVDAFCRILGVEGEEKTPLGIFGRNLSNGEWIRCNLAHTVIQDSHTLSLEFRSLSLQRT